MGSATKGLKAVAGAVLNAKTAIVGLVGAAGFGLLISRILQATDTLTKTASRSAQPLRLLGLYVMPLILLAYLRRRWIWLCKGLPVRTAEAAQKGMGEAKGRNSRTWVLNAQELNRMPLDEAHDCFG